MQLPRRTLLRVGPVPHPGITPPAAPRDHGPCRTPGSRPLPHPGITAPVVPRDHAPCRTPGSRPVPHPGITPHAASWDHGPCRTPGPRPVLWRSHPLTLGSSRPDHFTSSLRLSLLPAVHHSASSAPIVNVSLRRLLPEINEFLNRMTK
ncbi:hypothetical protein J1605_011853 [Eschrichtius robustus]|uniref:Uncharacterized protein n=1 Tax=Eschrichtius robustus TaxID=9764 RepID=A0AB34GNK7_ESCRO|nr:hypothetical protein J1605_011853 [Eschrichtius robustus]